MTKLSEIARFYRGLTYKKTDEVSQSFNVVLRANNINRDTSRLDFSELKYISDTIEVAESKKIQTNSILMCMASGSKSHLGKVAFIDKDYGYAFGGFMGMIIPDESKVYPGYLFRVLTSSRFKNLIANLTEGANINNLKFSQIEDFDIELPSLEDQHQIITKLNNNFDKIDNMIRLTNEKRTKLEDLKESMLELELFGVDI